MHSGLPLLCRRIIQNSHVSENKFWSIKKNATSSCFFKKKIFGSRFHILIHKGTFYAGIRWVSSSS